MVRRTFLLTLKVSVATATAALLTLRLVPAAANAATHYRQLIGTVSSSTYLEASVPSTGTYAIEYDITANAAFFDTYVDGKELGYVGGGTGAYLTRSVKLRGSGHLIQVVGPEGVGSANVYIVSAG